MMMSRISKYSFALLLCSLPFCKLRAFVPAPPDTARVKGIQYDSREAAAEAMRKADAPFLAGASLSGDLVGLAMVAASAYGQVEAAFRLNLKQRFFPTFEMGWGICDHTEYSTSLHYKTNAPYFRLGCDYNLAKDRFSGNRIFVGLRYAFTSFSYDLEGPPMQDPVWGTETPYSFSGVKSGAGWAEAVFGLEAKIWKIFHLGWTFRYKMRIHEKQSSPGSAWYVPGYGKNGGHALGGTFNIIFDI